MTSRLTFLMMCCLMGTYLPLSARSYIRINQLGYTPTSLKVAVFVSDQPVYLTGFTVKDALTGETVFSSGAGKAYKAWGPFTCAYRLDFSSFSVHGAYYIETEGFKSPVFPIASDVYKGSADLLLRYLRQQRCGYNPFLHDSCHTHDGYVIYHPGYDSAYVDVRGGWHDATDYLKYTATSANAVTQLLLAYLQNPAVFRDRFLANGEPGSNGIPDIVDEAVWGIRWLLKMNPDSVTFYNQIADDRDHQGFRLPDQDSVSYGKDLERPVYFCTGRPQGIFTYQNHATGIASTAGKFSSAFALGSLVMQDFNHSLSTVLARKAKAAYQFGMDHPGVCQTAPCTAPYYYEEENWQDDMELAGACLYQLTREEHYLDQAVQFGRKEQVTPWMGGDTARHYQWYPFYNLGHWEVALNSHGPLGLEFMGYWKKGLQAVYERGKDNPFLNGIPFIWCSNNLTVALISQCHLYARITGDHSFDPMEAALRDWLLGCNPWGSSMVIGLPEFGDYPSEPHSSLWVLRHFPITGGLVDGPVYRSIFQNLKGIFLAGGDEYQLFQSSKAVYHDDYADYSTNEPTMDGTADFTYYLSAMEAEEALLTAGREIGKIERGALIRGDIYEKTISLVFTGHDFADGYQILRTILHKHHILASFFFTGDFYRNSAFRKVIRGLQKDGHFLGPHSDKHLLYCDWLNRDSMLVTKPQFIEDLRANYRAMNQAGVKFRGVRYFLPPYEWYNDTVAAWCRQFGLKLINFTPGTSSNQDWTFPGDSNLYLSSDTLYNRILRYEQVHAHGLNGFILLTHIGTDPRRIDKFYLRMDNLLTALENKGYRFVSLDELTAEP